MKKKCIVLLSGGLDSATALYLAKSQDYDVYALSFSYGQRHTKELDYAYKIAKEANVCAHQVIDLNIGVWGGSALTDLKISVPDSVESNEIPITYVPARNMVFLSIAASYAEAIGARDIFIGVSEVDYSGYVDCRKEFIDSMENTINLGTVCGAEHNDKIKIHAPFINMKKAEEIKLGISLGLDYKNTWSCYKGLSSPCEICDSCKLRAAAFKEANIKDPLLD